MDKYDLTPMRLSGELESALGLDENLSSKMPWLQIPPGYSIQVIFPFRGALIRFQIRKDSNPSNSISVYLDVKDQLGWYGAPYWEAYPIGDDTARFKLSEHEKLMAAIIEELNKETK